MTREIWENDIKEILSFGKCKHDHKAIRRKSTEYMEDLQEDLTAEIGPAG